MPRRVLHDRYFKQAKAEGYLARSAYKLLEIQQRKRLIRKGDRVLDLGCAPGSWLQVASDLTGPAGIVVGIDLSDVSQPIAPNVRTLTGDINDIDPRTLLGDSGRKFNVVLSDMAPKTTGAGDAYLSARLCQRVLDLVPHVLGVGGNLAMKVLEGEPYPDLLTRGGRMFTSARGFKPAASRDASREIYLIATDLRAPGAKT